jgi:hypothetical protein
MATHRAGVQRRPEGQPLQCLAGPPSGVGGVSDSGAVVPNGYATAITVASPMIQVQNICGRGAAAMSGRREAG